MNDLAIKKDQVNIWDAPKEVKKLFAPDLTDQEFEFFMGLGSGLGANPFLREIWAVKYGQSPAQVFLGRDFYRKKSEELDNYDGHVVDAVYSSHDFKIIDGVPSHNYQLKDRGELLGAYCCVYRKNTKKPYYVFVEFREYYQGNKNEDGTVKMRKWKDGNGQWKSAEMKQTLWDTKPATMIKKVAEAQALRGAFQGVFAGTYDESEDWGGGSQKRAEQEINAKINGIEPIEEPMMSTNQEKILKHLIQCPAFSGDEKEVADIMYAMAEGSVTHQAADEAIEHFQVIVAEWEANQNDQ